MKQEFAQNLDYWIHKTKAFLHDPPDKAIHIPGHEERANELLAAMGLVGSSLSKEEYQTADIIASGMDRACLPGYVAGDENKNGAIDFSSDPMLTHPTGGDSALTLALPNVGTKGNAAVTAINAEIQALLQEDLGSQAGSGKGLSEGPAYKGNENAFAPARFHYLYFMLRRRLAQKNIGNLGGLWHRLPADTRLPDHSIWQHCSLVSALASCERLSGQNKASLMVYALTPVQDFVGRARKLRDYWSGSVILSWLAFEGIKAVMHRYGADHIVYPSLHGQPLVDELLQGWGMERPWFDEQSSHGIASFPNKFVCLVPAGQEQEAARAIEAAINAAWLELGDKTLAFLAGKITKIGEDESIRKQFSRQLDNYWEHHWSAAPLVRGEDRAAVEELLHKGSIDPAFDFWKDANKIWPSTGEGPLYSVSHRLVQAGLAAGKSRREDRRIGEEGIKCDLFGEFEILHYQDQADKNPKPSDDPLWQDVRQTFKETADFGNNERLCALGLVKRLAYRVCKELKAHPLHRMFREAETFQSSTEMALHDWWRQINNLATSQDDHKAQAIAQELSVFDWSKDSNKAHRKVAQWLHGINEEKVVEKNGCDIERIDLRNKKEKAAARELFKLYPVKDIHKYYAVLMMDGDRMGKLINGESLGSTWGSVLHPQLKERLEGKNFDAKFKNFWAKWLGEPRLISPAVHAAISEALGDFSIHTVPAIIEKKYHGRLIYAGGDDVCAVLPASTALDAARDIANAYGQGFVQIQPGKQAEAINGGLPAGQEGKLGVHLGLGEKISISAGIMIAHHKKPLGSVIDRAHALLNMAKKEGIHGEGRNAFALEVDKRSGGGRIFMAGWKEEKDGVPLLDHFLATAKALQETEEAAMSSSLAYRLSTFEDGLLPLLAKHPEELQRFIAKQLDRSGLNKELFKEEKDKQLQEIATHVAALIGRKDDTVDGKGKLPLESLIVANFIGHCQNQGEQS